MLKRAAARTRNMTMKSFHDKGPFDVRAARYIFNRKFVNVMAEGGLGELCSISRVPKNGSSRFNRIMVGLAPL